MTPIEVAAADVLALARAEIRKRAPYVMITVLGLVPVWVPGLKTLAVTEAMVLAIDPEWFAALPFEKAAAAIYHESEHIIRNHIARCAHVVDHKLANIGMDMAINCHIRAAGWVLPHGVYPDQYGFPDNLSVEEYIDLLLKRRAEKQKEAQQQPGGSGQPQAGKAGGKPGTETGPGGKGKEPKTAGEPGTGQGGGDPDLPDNHEGPGVGAGQCGGVAGNPLSNELEQQLNAEHGRSQQERQVIAKQTQHAINEHVKQFGRGSVPGGLQQVIDVSREAGEVRWNAELRHVTMKLSGLIESGGMDYSLARISKRSYARGRPMPGLVQQTPEVAIIVDTSASMGLKQLKACMTETVSVMRALGIDTVWLIQADTKVAAPPARVRARDLLGKLEVHGRGGTSFDAGLQALTKLKPRPNLVIYMTDGDGQATYRPPGIAVIWCVVRGHWNRKPIADFGHVIVVAEDAAERAQPTPQGRAL